MDNKESFNFNFDDKYEEIIASMQKKEEEYEDIVSDSNFVGGKHSFEDISSTSKGNKFKIWWKNLSKKRKTLLISATSIVLVIAIALGWFFTYFRYNYNEITTNPDELGFTNIIDKGVVNIALFGVDSRDENVFKGNTDSIMILSLNTKVKKVKIFSVMRDTFVPMEYKGDKYYGKINSAYSKGPEHAIKTLNNAFDLDISEYATVNFFGMVDIIDAVGGITATITKDELAWKGFDHPNLNNCMDEICREKGLDPKKYYISSAGEQTLNGVQAVAYARVRHCRSVWGTNNDYGRTDRQRHVMQELFNKAITMKKSQYASLAKALIPCSETSLSYADILGLATNILLSSPTFEQYRLPQDDFVMTFRGSSRYGSVVYYDLDYVSKLLHAVIYDDVTMEQYIEENGVEKKDWFGNSSNSGSSGGGSNSGTASSQKPNQDTQQNNDLPEKEPVTEKEPVEEEEPPIEEEKDPAKEEEPPTEEEKDPAEEEKDPTEEEKDPAEEEKDPNQTPEENDQLPSTPEDTTRRKRKG